MRRLYALTMMIFSVVTPARCLQAAGVDQRWLSYEPAILRLEGKLTMELKYGPPNYGEQPKTDARIRVPVLKLIEPVNVRGKPGESFNAISVKGIRRIQLILSPGTSYEQFIGKRVVVEGTLFHAFSGHHYTKVLMDVRTINRRLDIPKVLHMHSVISEESAESLALFYAAGAGDQARVQSLIKAGFDVNGRDENRRTPLFPAARNRPSSASVNFLGFRSLAAKETNQQDSEVKSPLISIAMTSLKLSRQTPVMVKLRIENTTQD